MASIGLRSQNSAFCADCVKSCAHDNVVLCTRAFGEELSTSGRRGFDESYLAVMPVGLKLLEAARKKAEEALAQVGRK